jgi:hypothetical protein
MTDVTPSDASSPYSGITVSDASTAPAETPRRLVVLSYVVGIILVATAGTGLASIATWV